MNILMLLDKVFPTDLRVENEATSLIKAGNRVGLLSVGNYEKSQVISYKGIKVYQVAISSFQSKKMAGLAGMLPWMEYFMAKQVEKIMLEDSYDALHFHDLILFGTARLLKKKHPSLLFVGDMHENYVEVLKDYKWVKKFPNNLIVSLKKWERKEIEWLGDMDKVITVSDGIRDRVISKGKNPEDVTVVPNTIHTGVFDEFKMDVKIEERFSDYFCLLYIGGFIENRGLEHVIEAMTKIKDWAPDCRMLLVGSGETERSLKKLVSSLNLNEHVFFEGWKTQEAMKSYLSVSKIGLVPFNRTPQTDMSSSNKLFQYMYYSLPVVGTNCTSVEELVTKDKCGVIYESKNAVQFEKAVKKLYENRNLLVELGVNGQKAVNEKYNWEVNIKQMLQMYQDLEKSKN